MGDTSTFCLIRYQVFSSSVSLVSSTDTKYFFSSIGQNEYFGIATPTTSLQVGNLSLFALFCELYVVRCVSGAFLSSPYVHGSLLFGSYAVVLAWPVGCFVPSPFGTPLRLCSVLLGLLLIMVCGLGLPLRAFIHHVVLAGGCRYICRGNRWVGELAVDDLTSVKSPGVGG